jgi:transposase
VKGERVTNTIMNRRRDTLEELIRMKKNIIEKCIGKKMRSTEGSKELHMHPKAFLRLKGRYKKEGESCLMPKKPGPKYCIPDNKTPEWVEEKVEEMAKKNKHLGPQPLAEKLFDEEKIEMNGSTVWRILKRRKVRYYREYVAISKEKPKLYCLEKPGQEMQLDGCFPAGRARKLVAMEAIDDSSRWSFGMYYDRETVDNALKFVEELVARAPFHIEALRVDNRYKKRFKIECEKRYGIEVRVNEPYEPTQNGKVERFHQTMKKEFFWRQGLWQTPMEEINYRYQLWLAHYNQKRRHGGFGMNRMTPSQKIVSTLLQSLVNTYITYPQKVTCTLQQHKISYR